ncbi:hypothetical protein STVA_39860 [Allostella vacuolata]|nr:hypothetical protein STVA_39860 [Stella vacuolata]
MHRRPADGARPRRPAETRSAAEPPPAASPAFGAAQALYRAGDAAGADVRCRAILAQTPGDLQALHLLGIIALGRGDHAAALKVFETALGHRPDLAALWTNHAAALQGLRRPEAARASLDRALAIDPGSVSALGNMASLLKTMGQLDSALLHVDRALALQPRSADLLSNRGNILERLHRPAEALAAFDAALAIRGDLAEALNGRATVLRALDRPQEALADLDRAERHRPPTAKTRLNRGLALMQLNLFDEALACFEAILADAPQEQEAILQQAVVLAELKRYDEAGDVLDALLAREPDAEAALRIRCDVRIRLGRFDEALLDAERALALNPGAPEAIAVQVRALRHVNRLDEAAQRLEAALEAAPDSTDLRSEYFFLLVALRRFAEATDHAERLVAQAPAKDSQRFVLGAHYLLLGRLREGWQHYESRHRPPKAALADGRRRIPTWTGTEPLAGRTILLQSEQGLGDTIQFCRYAPRVHRLGARVLLWVQSPLKGLMHSLEGVDAVLGAGDAHPDCDFRCALMSLPHAFGTTVETVPAAHSYLAAEPARIEAWRRRLPDDGRPRIGIVWSGNPRYGNDRNRSARLDQFRPLFDLDAHFVSLQKEVRAADMATLRGEPRLLRVGEELTDFSDTAGLVANLDLVVSVDTSVGHLSAALGRPTWFLLPATPCWRWMLDRSDTPWYPTATLFRQQRANDWPGVIGRVREALLEDASFGMAAGSHAQGRMAAGR